MRIYLIRHGDPDYKNDDLTPRGHAEAEALAETLAKRDLGLLFSSPLGRARRTASYTEKRLDMTAEVLPWTAELRLAAIQGPKDAAWNTDPRDLRTPEGPCDVPAWTEVFDTLKAESDAWLSRLGWQREAGIYRRLKNASVAKDTQIALFCHGGFGLTWLAHLLDIPMQVMWSSFMLRTSSITTLLWEERDPDIAIPRVISMSELPHLDRAGLEPSSAGLVANVI